MTSTRPPEDLLTARLRDVVLATTVGAVVGIVGGLASVLIGARYDQLWWLEPLVHDLGPWATASSVVGYVFRRQLSVAVWGGLVTQVALTLSYAAGYAQRHDWLTFGRAFSVEDLLLALVAGPVFGAVGALLRDDRERVRVTCLALAAAPWFADGFRDVLAGLEGSHQAVLAAIVSFVVGHYGPRELARSKDERGHSQLVAMVLGVVISSFLYLL